MVWYSHLSKNFPQFVLIHRVKAFSIVNGTEVVCLFVYSFPCIFCDLVDIGNLISGFSAFSNEMLLKHAKTPGFLAPGGEEFNPGPETRLDHSKFSCNKILLKYEGDRESF